MNKLSEGTRRELGACVTQRLLESGIDAREVAVEIADAEQVERQLEEVAELPFCALPPALNPAKRRHVVIEAGQQLRPCPLRRRRLAMF